MTAQCWLIFFSSSALCVEPIAASGTRNSFLPQKSRLNRLTCPPPTIRVSASGRHTLTFGFGADSDNFTNFIGADYGSLADQGSYHQIQRTVFLRDDVALTPRLAMTAALFHSDYDTLQIRRFDPHLAFVYRPDSVSALRFAFGSGFVPPRLSDRTGITQSDLQFPLPYSACPTNEPACMVIGGNAQLAPETAVGYDLGYQRLFKNGSKLDVSLYRNMLFNHFYFSIFPLPAGYNFPNGDPALFENGPINVGRSIFTGIELSLHQSLSHHLFLDGYYDTQSAYPIDVDLATLNASPTLNKNQQFFGIPLHKYGAELSYESPRGTSAYFDWTYYDVNNAYSLPSFSLYDAGFTLPSAKNRPHVTATNLVNRNAQLHDSLNGGFASVGILAVVQGQNDILVLPLQVRRRL